MRERYVIANLKMNLAQTKEREHYLEGLRAEWEKNQFQETRLIVCPAFPFLLQFREHLPPGIAVGAQNVFWEQSGKYTGEVSPEMVRATGAEFVIVGHSERRQYLGETTEMIARKVSVAVAAGLCPVLCIGETAKEHAQDEALSTIREQLEGSLGKLDQHMLEKIVLVYEPSWAVGTDMVPTLDEIMQMQVFFKKILMERYPAEAVKKIPILYGGSVKEKMAVNIVRETGMDGVLVGGESLVPKDIIGIVVAVEG